MVQREYAARRLGKKRNSGISIYASRIKCGECGSWYGAKTWHSTSKYRRIIYRCNGKYDGDQKCGTRHLIEADIRTAFLDAVNQLLANRDEIITNLTAIQAELFDTTALTSEQAALKTELGVITGLINEAIAENARVAQDQAEYQQRHAALVERYDATKERLTEATEQTAHRKTRGAALETFIRELRDQPELIEKWDAQLWVTLVDHITVNVGGNIAVTFKDGSEVAA